MTVTDPGLCGHCTHCRLVEAARSRFYLCGLSAEDPRFRKYPPLPVVTCSGHVEGSPQPLSAGSSGRTR